MTRLGKLAVCLAGGLVLATVAPAQTLAVSGNPYLPIVVRNVFGLNPIPTNVPGADDAAQLPKITPKGITDILGQLQVLFNVAPKPGQKDAKEESYILGEGQQQDDIEVVRIDEKESMVTFNNHGTVQALPLANAPSLSTPAPAAGGGGGGGPGIIPTRLGGNRPGPGGGGQVIHFGGQGGRGQVTIGGNNPNSGMGGSPTSGGTSTQTKTGFGGYSSGQQAQAAQTGLSAEDQMVLMTHQHLQAQQSGDPSSALYPPTPFDPEAGINPPALPTTTTSRRTRQ